MSAETQDPREETPARTCKEEVPEYDGVRIVGTDIREGTLFITGDCECMQKLVSNIRRAVQKFLAENERFVSWAECGIEKEGGPQAYPEEDPTADPRAYAAANADKPIKWRYKQTVKMTRGLL